MKVRRKSTWYFGGGGNFGTWIHTKSTRDLPNPTCFCQPRNYFHFHCRTWRNRSSSWRFRNLFSPQLLSPRSWPKGALLSNFGLEWPFPLWKIEMVCFTRIWCVQIETPGLHDLIFPRSILVGRRFFSSSSSSNSSQKPSGPHHIIVYGNSGLFSRQHWVPLS